jgi:PKD repeat protein
MKTITKHLKSLTVFCLIASAKISLAQSPCATNFTAYAGSNGSYTFVSNAVMSSSVNPTIFYWNFGNGSPTSTIYVSTATATNFTANGTYVVNLFSLNSSLSCSNNISQTITVSNVTTPTCNLNANFSYTLGSNGSAYFVSTSTGVTGNTNYYWNFGDATFGSNTSASHNYVNGTYTVVLTVTDSIGSFGCINSSSQVITITSSTVIPALCNLSAGFNATSSNGSTWNFNNTSAGTNSNTVYLWSFGDGNSSTAMNPTHTYLNGGSYTALLYIYDGINPSCNDTITQVLTVGASTCLANAGFSLSPTNTPQIWNAFPASPLNVVGATWSWGDGSTSNTLYTSHTYSVAGMYNICLTVTVSCGAIDTVCASYSIYKMTGTAQDMNIIQINVVDLSSVGIKSVANEAIEYSISPNPNNGLFDLNLKGVKSKNVSILVYNVVGVIVYETFGETTNDGFTKNIQLDDTSSGVYFIKVSTDNHVTTKKIIINK